VSALICTRCGGEIRPGTKVEFISTLDVAEARILTSDQALVVHADPDDCVGSNE
jgi:hypothetical protein